MVQHYRNLDPTYFRGKILSLRLSMRQSAETEIRDKQRWSLLLRIFGFGMMFGIFDQLFVVLVRVTEHIDIRQYEHPHFDAYTANEPIVGAILLVGGLILRYMPGQPQNQA